MTPETPPAIAPTSRQTAAYVPAAYLPPPDLDTFVHAVERLRRRVFNQRHKLGATDKTSAQLSDLQALAAIVRDDPASLPDALPLLGELWDRIGPLTVTRKPPPVRTVRTLSITPERVAKRAQQREYEARKREALRSRPWPTVPSIELGRAISPRERARFATGEAEIWDVCGLWETVTEAERKAWSRHHEFSWAIRADERKNRAALLAIIADATPDPDADPDELTANIAQPVVLLATVEAEHGAMTANIARADAQGVHHDNHI